MEAKYVPHYKFLFLAPEFAQLGILFCGYLRKSASYSPIYAVFSSRLRAIILLMIWAEPS